ncbi:hypothetical protein T12_69 [Trichinella patagoniensis]|uniref:Uncharacterized protein n=1 Tax=Trichinella patagoniensis TaxID=990121 RepID=A0A0V0Z8S8_9BILA|nr:hypothetical protein T12_69 [Trichinella patagoniensis]
MGCTTQPNADNALCERHQTEKPTLPCCFYITLADCLPALSLSSLPRMLRNDLRDLFSLTHDVLQFRNLRSFFNAAQARNDWRIRSARYVTSDCTATCRR